LGVLLRQLDGVKRVLMIGAHPDDEDTSLLATLARAWGVETAYLSLTRGEGGQNLIGPELAEGLGIVRTGELMAARSVDGGRQFFTRAMDFGYSKRAEETLSVWLPEKLLWDVVWVVRRFRPQVIVSVFTGTPADGHGQHQAAGILAQQAFSVAADPGRFPEQFAHGVGPWRVMKLYRAAWRDPGSATSTVQTGKYDPLLGRSHFQIAMESRSQHRSQDMGVAQPLGPQSSGLVLLKSRVEGVESILARTEPDVRDAGLLAGVDTSITSLAGLLPPGTGGQVRGYLEAYRQEIQTARRAFPSMVAPGGPACALSRALNSLDQAVLASVAAVGEHAEPSVTLQARRRKLEKALVLATGVVVDVRASDDLVVPGETFRVDVEVWNGGPVSLSDVQAVLPLPPGAEARPTEPPRLLGRFAILRGEVQTPTSDRYVDVSWSEHAVGDTREIEPGGFERWSFLVRLGRDGPLSRLYYLGQERDGAMYRWPESPDLWALPRDPAVLEARVNLAPGSGATAGEACAGEIRTGSGPLSLYREVEFRGVDKAEGEYRKPVLAVPEVSVEIDAEGMVWPRDLRTSRLVTVTVGGYAEEGVSGTIRLEAPGEWKVEPSSLPFSLGGPGVTGIFRFEIAPTGELSTGRFVLRAVATTDSGVEYREKVSIIDYEHIQRTLLFERAEATVSVFPVRVAEGLRVGYVMGSGDAGLEALRHLGLEPEPLGPAALEAGDLGGFDVIVLGVRAYETRPDLVAYNERLLGFARNGGTIIAQYNKHEYALGGFAPYPVSMSRPAERVSLESAPVRVLDPESPIFNTPNRITAEDFDGWVQERGLYFLSEWDDRYAPLLAMADPEEEPKRGSLLVARVGKGLYVYTGLSFFRQFPAGVPGAYRLFANLVSARSGDWTTPAGPPRR
jgi:LmbE family N-acetylglucosaminyl deacetylase